MIVEIPAYKHIEESQEIDFTNKKLCTLIGENGSGKSTLLESIFNKYIENENNLRDTFVDEVNNVSYLDTNNFADTNRCIVFSSGQNQLFSKIFNNNEKNSRTFGRREVFQANSFYFNYEWCRLLVFFASAIKPDGLVHNYLLDKNYIDVDNNLILRFAIRVRQPLLDAITRELYIESTGNHVENALYRSLYIEYLEKLLNVIYDEDYDFTDTENLYRIVSSRVDFNADQVIDSLGNDINKIFTFFARASSSWLSNFKLNDMSLYLKDNLEFDQLSDGEYQLLAIYALIDLFDNENTIFLLDEIDSHLHFKNITKLWDSLNNIEGKVLTTTHILDSIILNEIDSLKIVDNARILNEVVIEDIIARIENISSNKSYKYKLASKVEYIALVENISDWFIFEELLKKKKPDYDNTIFKKVHPINCSSGYENKSDDFGKSKILWFQEFKSVVEREENKLKEIFMICDKDELHENRLNSNLTVKLDDFQKKELKKYDGKTFPRLLSWKRREIENYFISATMLEYYEKKEDIEKLLPRELVLENNSMDIVSIQNLEVKDIIKSLFSNEDGNDYDKIKEVIAKIPPEEISVDIVKMYEFIKSKV